MIKAAQQGVPGAESKRRWQEVEERLAEFGLACRPRRLRRGAGAAEFEHTRARRLRLALESLGPVFSAFGLYLSTRPDLMPERDRLELAAIADHAPPAPLPLIEESIRSETGYALAEAYRDFEETPFESRLLSQSHYAELGDGTQVVVKVLRPGVAGQVACDALALAPLKAAFAGWEIGEEVVDAALADFADGLRRQSDLLHEAEALEALARSAEEFEMLSAPAPRRGLCAPGVLTVERQPGQRLDGLLASFGGQDEGGAGRGVDGRQLARVLCLVWLRQALHDQPFPVEPRAADIMILPGGRVAFAGGMFAGLPPEPRANLWDYLVAAATDSPDRACSSLLREMRPGGPSDCDDDLRRRFRQLVPRREIPWSDGNDDLADHLFAQWRLAAGRGYVPLAHLACFYRGLFVVARLARQLAPERDALTEGIQDMRLMACLGQMREMMKFRQLGDQMDRYAALMLDLPQRLDEALTLAAEGRARLRLQMPEPTAGRGRKKSSAKLAALLLVLAAFVLWAHHPAAPATGAWADGAEAFIFVALGALALRAATRA